MGGWTRVGGRYFCFSFHGILDGARLLTVRACLCRSMAWDIMKTLARSRHDRVWHGGAWDRGWVAVV